MKSRSLVDLDISWNDMLPMQMYGLLTVLSKNRRLTNLNLSWNALVES